MHSVSVMWLPCGCHVTSGKANSHCAHRQQFDDSWVVKLHHLLRFPEEVNNLLRMVSRMFAYYNGREGRIMEDET